ncbi:MAG: YcbK family protein [Kofleriaceae bacterium]
MIEVLAARLTIAAITVATVTAAAEPPSKKHREHLAKTPARTGSPAVGTKPAKLINIYNQWTHEWLAVEPTRLPSQDTINEFFRDHFTNEHTQFDGKLLPALIAAASRFKVDSVFIVSSFRHPKYNLMLRKKGRQVARDSQHTHGNAVDFFLPKVPIHALHAWAKQQRLGGVGIYLGSGFIHMDTGAIRYWSGE